MNRRRFLGLAGALGAGAVASACGVPGNGNPVYMGAAPTPGPQLGSALEPPKPLAAVSARTFVENYLKVAAGANYTGGDKPDALAQAKQRALEYMTPAAQQQWSPGKDLTVVRVVLTEGGAVDNAITITADFELVGVLNDRGALEPSTVTQLEPETFKVMAVGATEYRLSTPPPPMLLLSDEGLQELYTARQLYFWEQIDNQSPTLVPDQRYLPKSIATAKQPAEIVRWLTAGPSPLVAPAVQPLPDFGVKETSLGDDGRLVVNLNSNAATLDADAKHRLAVQLRWSVDRNREVDLRIEGAPTNVSADDYVKFNLAAANADGGESERFCVDNGRVIAVEPIVGGPTPILAGPDNKDAVLAAIPRNKRNLAVVKAEGKNRHLFLVSLSGTGETRTPAYTSTNVIGSQVSRPVWITRPTAQALVAVDRRLVAVPASGSGGASAVAVAMPSGLTGAVTAFAVSPEGRRIALVVDGQVVVAALLIGDQIRVGDGYRIVKTPLSEQRAVGWSDETRLIVGGAAVPGTKVTLIEIAIDGSGRQTVPRQTANLDVPRPVDQLAVRPAGPLGVPGTSLTLFDSSGTAYVAYATSIATLPPNETPISPSPSPSHLSAPFFLD